MRQSLSFWNHLRSLASGHRLRVSAHGPSAARGAVVLRPPLRASGASCGRRAIPWRAVSQFHDVTSLTRLAGGGAPAGRAWRAAELRLKSFDDLHKLYYVLLKERNALLTQRAHARQVGMGVPDPHRLKKVKLSMARIQVVLGERRRARAAAMDELFEAGEFGIDDAALLAAEKEADALEAGEDVYGGALDALSGAFGGGEGGRGARKGRAPPGQPKRSMRAALKRREAEAAEMGQLYLAPSVRAAIEAAEADGVDVRAYLLAKVAEGAIDTGAPRQRPNHGAKQQRRNRFQKQNLKARRRRQREGLA